MGLVCSVYPEGVKAEGKRRGEICLAACPGTPRYGLLGALMEPATLPGKAFLGAPRPTQIGAAGSLQFSPLYRSRESSRAAWAPRAAPETYTSLNPAPRGSPASHATYVAVCIGGGERPLCVCGSAGLPCPCLLSV